jgi:hypothetical protein
MAMGDDCKRMTLEFEKILHPMQEVGDLPTA